jgi:phosphatidylserine/phosphatidylglycerophosphate/cardiolipin synthase-like enzyme
MRAVLRSFGIAWLAALALALPMRAVAADTDADVGEDGYVLRGPPAPRSNVFIVLPDDGRAPYLQAFASAKREIRIEICVLQDPQLLAGIQTALKRGVRARAIVDRGKYHAIASEQANLAQYLTDAGGELHLSNPLFPRSFPKIILIDDDFMIYGSACLDETTFLQYRDFGHGVTDRRVLRDVQRLFENDWAHSAPDKQPVATYNPTPPITADELLLSPVNSAAQLVRFFQQARRTLDVYTELLGNPTLESELAAAVTRGVKVRLIAPQYVNGATPAIQELQDGSLADLVAAGIRVHVSPKEESAARPYMHARAAIADGDIAYLGSISLSPDAITFNREMGLISREREMVRRLQAQFESDYRLRTSPFAAAP